jgi:hypothetical protein
MASAFSHAVAALSIGTCFYRPQIPKRVWAAGGLCSVDAVGFRFGIHYGDFWGHRGFTHSLVFAVITSQSQQPCTPAKQEQSRQQSRRTERNVERRKA